MDTVARNKSWNQTHIGPGGNEPRANPDLKKYRQFLILFQLLFPNKE
jgi:hypothetical protein